MATGRGRAEWDRTAALIAVGARLMGGKAVHPNRLNPYRREPARSNEQQQRDWTTTCSRIRAFIKARAMNG